ncbi:MAG: helix-turn-helix domain-containing protein [Thermaerobacter sp.]|nr:helix-turn-helix domain-containing protein [Thermaerobacter sp.]
MMTEDERDAWALFRYRLISPLLDPAASRADKAAYYQFVCDHPPTAPTGQPVVPSVRTLQRYQHQYRHSGFDALRPQPRTDLGSLRASRPRSGSRRWRSSEKCRSAVPSKCWRS